jgi:diaminohydroxyphosphoribosylaminopyrimidine deaminase/5-amino-6-(5-phosphoribosylamino)uracil reductase
MNKKKLERWDVDFMSLCLSLARQGEGRTAPNPMVGSVVVNGEGSVVGKGFHQAAGEAHAEVNALDAAGEAAAGGTLYVNLEPCNHHGRTPPCTERVIASGVKRVVVGMQDPHEVVNGAGIRKLEDAGIEVVTGVMSEECTWLNRAFIKTCSKKQPWVILKLATTLDGRIADRFGNSRWITGPDARQYVHRLRNRVDCVLVGKKTVVADDPALNVRDVARGRNPLRAVTDSNLSISKKSRIFRPDTGGATVVFCNEGAAAKAEKEDDGGSNGAVKLFGVKTEPESNFLDMNLVLNQLASMGVNSLLCEGGGQLAASLLHNELVDEVHWILAPKIIGDLEASPSVADRRPIHLADAMQLYNVRHFPLGDDVLLHGVTKAYESYRPSEPNL